MISNPLEAYPVFRIAIWVYLIANPMVMIRSFMIVALQVYEVNDWCPSDSKADLTNPS